MNADPNFPTGPDGSSIFSVEDRDRRDFEGNVDWEKGVVGEVKAAAAFGSFGPIAKDVARVGRDSFVAAWGTA